MPKTRLTPNTAAYGRGSLRIINKRAATVRERSDL